MVREALERGMDSFSEQLRYSTLYMEEIQGQEGSVDLAIGY